MDPNYKFWSDQLSAQKMSCKEITAEKDHVIAEKDRVIAEKDRVIAEKDAQIKTYKKMLGIEEKNVFQSFIGYFKDS